MTDPASAGAPAERRTLWIVLDEMDLMWLPVTKTWLLNERHYGSLQGLNKAETAAKYGDEQVEIWRRSYDVPPGELDAADERWLGEDPRYSTIAVASGLASALRLASSTAGRSSGETRWNITLPVSSSGG